MPMACDPGTCPNSSGETSDERSLVRAEPGRLSGGDVFGHAVRARGGGNRDMATRLAQDPLE